MNILLVDDDRHSISALSNLLEFEHSVDFACNGDEAFGLYAENSYDLIVSDIQMPVMNGIELLKAIRATNTRVPVIFITGHANRKNEREAETLGVSAFFPKPLDVTRFMTEVARIESHCQT